MKNYLLAAVLSVSAFNANADVLTFENAGPQINTSAAGDTHEILPVAGLEFTNFFSLRASSSDTGYRNNIVSGEFVAFNSYGQAGSIFSSSGDNFQFYNAWLGAAWNNGLSILITGFVNGAEVYKKEVIVGTTGATFVEFGWEVDALTFISSGGVHAGSSIGSGTQFTLDDFNTNLAAVPEPSAYAMLGLGLGLLGVAARRRKAA